MNAAPVIAIILSFVAGPASRPATRPAHVTTADERARIIEINRDLTAMQSELRDSKRRLAGIGAARKFRPTAQHPSIVVPEKPKRTPSEIQEEMASLRSELSRIRQGTWDGPPPEKPAILPMDDLHIGMIGVPGFSKNVALDRDWDGWQILQIIGPNDYMISAFGRRVWITGESASGLVDGQKTRLQNVYRVKGTKTYGAAIGGSSTVFVLEPESQPAH